MSTKSSCALSSFSTKTLLPNTSATSLIKTLTCYSQGQTFCESPELLDFCTFNAEIKCGNTVSSPTTSKCHCFGIGNCFCSFGCSISLLLLLVYVGFFVLLQFYKGYPRLISAVRVEKNLRRVFANTPGESLCCLNWIRNLSLLSVILGHFHQIIGKVYAEPAPMHSFLSMFFVHNMSLSVDSFLLLGGLLCSYTWELKKKAGTIPKGDLSFWVRFGFLRWYRLAPPLMAMILFSNVFGHMVLPELWMGSADQKLDCSATWLTMVTFTNNIFPNTCMRWLWYLALDMQLYVFAMCFLFALEKFGRKLVCVASLCVIAMSLVYRGYLAYVIEIPILYVADAPVWEPIMQKIYVKAFPRVAPYLLGLISGANLDKAMEFFGKTSKLRQITFFSFLMLGYAYFGGFYEYFFKVDSVHRIFYLSVFRIAYAVPIAWLALMCTSRHVNFFNKLMTVPFLVPIAKLSFSAYLIHPLVIGSFVQRLLYSYVPLSLNIDYAVLLGGPVIFGCVMFCALGFYLVFEAPLANLRPAVEAEFAAYLKKHF